MPGIFSHFGFFVVFGLEAGGAARACLANGECACAAVSRADTKVHVECASASLATASEGTLRCTSLPCSACDSASTTCCSASEVLRQWYLASVPKYLLLLLARSFTGKLQNKLQSQVETQTYDISCFCWGDLVLISGDPFKAPAAWINNGGSQREWERLHGWKRERGGVKLVAACSLILFCVSSSHFFCCGFSVTRERTVGGVLVVL